MGAYAPSPRPPRSLPSASALGAPAPSALASGGPRPSSAPARGLSRPRPRPASLAPLPSVGGRRRAAASAQRSPGLSPRRRFFSATAGGRQKISSPPQSQPSAFSRLDGARRRHCFGAPRAKFFTECNPFRFAQRVRHRFSPFALAHLKERCQKPKQKDCVFGGLRPPNPPR